MRNQTNSPIYRPEGMTESERYLKELADHSFLSLWSYLNVYKDQGRTHTQREGKELCDLLVVFQDHIIIFSDKNCAVGNSGNLDLDWSRWYKKAIEKSAEQIWRAEHWIIHQPNLIYLDPKCTIPFPIPLPNPAKAKFHRVIVAHGAAARCKIELGGSGSLMIDPTIIGGDHKKPRIEGGKPFVIGQIDPDKGYVHIFDDNSLDIALKKLDTITDFVNYLQKKEKFVLSKQFEGAAGEEELLGYYVNQLNSEGEHDFVVPEGKSIFLEKGIWENFLKSPKAKAQKEADEISYVWDGLINNFSKHFEAGTFYYSSHPDEGIAHFDNQLVFLAQLPRLQRRIFASALINFLQTPIPSSQNLYIRTIEPTLPNKPYYVFLVMRQSSSASDEIYRVARRTALEFYCKVTKERYAEAEDIIGYATEPGLLIDERSEDLIYFDAKAWKPEEDLSWQQLRQQQKIASSDERCAYQFHEDEYPKPNTLRINIGDDYFEIQRPIRNQNIPVEKKPYRKPAKTPKPRAKVKLQKKKPGPRAARRRQK